MSKRFKVNYKLPPPPKGNRSEKTFPSILDQKDLLSTKKTSSLLICGTGNSITDNRREVSSYARKYDSIGIDWFCKSYIQTKYYFVRNQVHHSSMVSHKDKETVKEFLRIMNSHYLRSFLIISKLNKEEFDDYGTRWNWGNKYTHFKSRKFIGSEYRSSSYRDMKFKFTEKCYRYSYDLFCVLQFAVTMKYDSIILAGFELNDNKCFWADETRSIQRKRGVDPMGDSVDYAGMKGMLNFYKNNFKKRIYTIDRDSRLLDSGLAFYVGDS